MAYTPRMTSLVKLLKRSEDLPPLGLLNLGNTCYLNSVLQCLTYTPPLASFCIRLLHSSNCDLVKKSMCPFCILEKRIALSFSTDADTSAPVKMKTCLRIYAEHFRPGRQEDAHEFLRLVIDACHDACLRSKRLQQKERAMDRVANGGEFGGTRQTVVNKIFGGALHSQVKCLSCQAVSNKVDGIMDISLDVLHCGSLRGALQKFFRPEVLHGNNKFKCDNCRALAPARKQILILEAPNVLVIHLKRFNDMFGGKIDRSIEFEETLLLSSYMCKSGQVRRAKFLLVLMRICILSTIFMVPLYIQAPQLILDTTTLMSRMLMVVGTAAMMTKSQYHPCLRFCRRKSMSFSFCVQNRGLKLGFVWVANGSNLDGSKISRILN